MAELKKARDTLSEHRENRSPSLTLDLELSTCSLPGRADADAEWGSPEPWPQSWHWHLWKCRQHYAKIKSKDCPVGTEDSLSHWLMNLLKVLLNHLLSPAEPLQDVILRSVTLKTNPLRILSSLTTAPQYIQSTLIGMCFNLSHLPLIYFSVGQIFFRVYAPWQFRELFGSLKGSTWAPTPRTVYELNPRRGSSIIILLQGARYQQPWSSAPNPVLIQVSRGDGFWMLKSWKLKSSKIKISK